MRRSYSSKVNCLEVPTVEIPDMGFVYLHGLADPSLNHTQHDRYHSRVEVSNGAVICTHFENRILTQPQLLKVTLQKDVAK